MKSLFIAVRIFFFFERSVVDESDGDEDSSDLALDSAEGALPSESIDYSYLYIYLLYLGRNIASESEPFEAEKLSASLAKNEKRSRGPNFFSFFSTFPIVFPYLCFFHKFILYLH